MIVRLLDLVVVCCGFVWIFDWDVDVLCLIGGEFGEFDINFCEVEYGNFFV